MICLISGLLLCFCNIRKPDINLDDIKANELLNVLLSCIADLFGFIFLILKRRIMRSKKVTKKKKEIKMRLN